MFIDAVILVITLLVSCFGYLLTTPTFPYNLLAFTSIKKDGLARLSRPISLAIKLYMSDFVWMQRLHECCNVSH